MASRAGVATALNRPASVNRTANRSRDFLATAPAAAASLADAMPVTTRPNTKGMTVIRSALSQIDPIGSATLVTNGSAPGL